MPTTRTDPIRSFKFEVQFIVPTTSNLGAPTNTGANSLGQFTEGLGSLGFAAMSGLAATNEVIQYREGGMNTHPHKMVGQTDFPPISFSRGVFPKQDQLWKWQRFIHNWQNGAPGSTGGADYRCDIVVWVYDHPHSNATYTDNAGYDTGTFVGNKKLGIKIFNAWPASFTMSGLNASGSDIMIHELSLVHEGFILAWSDAEIAALDAQV